jgi:hypothetical protein
MQQEHITKFYLNGKLDHTDYNRELLMLLILYEQSGDNCSHSIWFFQHRHRVMAKWRNTASSLDLWMNSVFGKLKEQHKILVEIGLDKSEAAANTDISNTTLGVYYKFNEGITG